jgi:two-component system, chemotaxis family, sensor kinase CheA
MALERNAFVENFLEETRENLRRVDDAVVALKRHPESREELNTFLRALHTIKGSSRMLKFKTMEQVAHAMETVFKGVAEERYVVTPALLQLVFVGSDLIRVGTERIATTGNDIVEVDHYLTACEQAASAEPFMEQLDQLRNETAVETTTGSGSSGDTITAKTGYETIRIKLSDVEAITETLNSVIIKQFQLKQFQETLEIIQGDVQEYLVEQRGAEVSELLKSIQGLRKDFTDQIVGLEQHSYKLQEQVMQLSMLPLELILGELPRMVAETSSILEKEIDFSVQGMDKLMDKAILEKLNDPIIHIVRNAVDHGIESPAERTAAGKRAEGAITVTCTAEGGNMIVRITDDGRGLKRDAIVARAVERGLVQEEDQAELSDTQVFGFIFLPGFSTTDSVSDLSGRGVGLDIVKTNIDSVKGKVTVQSTPGEGTEFVLAVPLSLATVTGFFVMAGSEKFLIPSNFVHKIVRLHRDDIIQYYHKDAFRLGREIVPIYTLSSLLGRRAEPRGPYSYVVVVESLGERTGMIVDEVLQHVSLIYKPVPRNLERLRPVQGIVFDENYRIINIMFVPELMSRFKRIKSIDLVTEELSKNPQQRVVLVVDDSRNTRDIEQSILELEGYTVLTAGDGIDALETLKSTRVDLVVTDINMPRMDGLTLIENLRKDASFGDIPVIVVTSETDREMTDSVRNAGANAHITKTEFDRSNLAELVHEQLQGVT